MKKKKASFLFAVLLSCSQVMGISIPVGAEEVIMEEETLETRQNTNSDGLENETETGQLEIMSLEEVPTDEVPEEAVQDGNETETESETESETDESETNMQESEIQDSETESEEPEKLETEQSESLTEEVESGEPEEYSRVQYLTLDCDNWDNEMELIALPAKGTTTIRLTFKKDAETIRDFCWEWSTVNSDGSLNIDADETGVLSGKKDGTQLILTADDVDETTEREIQIFVYEIDEDGEKVWVAQNNTKVRIVEDATYELLPESLDQPLIPGEPLEIVPKVYKYKSGTKTEMTEEIRYYFEFSDIIEVVDAQGNIVEPYGGSVPASSTPFTIKVLPAADGVYYESSIRISVVRWDEQEEREYKLLSREWSVKLKTYEISFKDINEWETLNLWEGEEKTLYLNTESLDEKCSIKWEVGKTDENGDWVSAPEDLWEKISQKNENGEDIEGIRLKESGWFSWAGKDSFTIYAFVMINGYKAARYSSIEARANLIRKEPEFRYSYQPTKEDSYYDVVLLIGKPLTISTDGTEFGALSDKIKIRWIVSEWVTKEVELDGTIVTEGEWLSAQNVTWVASEDGRSVTLSGTEECKIRVKATYYLEEQEVYSAQTDSIIVITPELRFESAEPLEKQMLKNTTDTVLLNKEYYIYLRDENYWGGYSRATAVIKDVDFSNPQVAQKKESTDGSYIWVQTLEQGKTDVIYTLYSEELWGKETRQLRTELTVTDDSYELEIDPAVGNTMLPGDSRKLLVNLIHTVGGMREVVDPSLYTITYSDYESDFLTVMKDGTLKTGEYSGSSIMPAEVTAYLDGEIVAARSFSIFISSEYYAVELPEVYYMEAGEETMIEPVLVKYSTENRTGEVIQDKTVHWTMIKTAPGDVLSIDGGKIRVKSELPEWCKKGSRIWCHLYGHADSSESWVEKDVFVEITGCKHVWNEESRKEATCTENGLITRVCTKCGEKESTEIAALGHKAVEDKAVAATCTKAGKTAGSHCSVCGEVLEVQKSVKALGHSWDAGEVTKAATCTEEGEKTYHCTRTGCTEVKIEKIAALGHKTVEDKAVAATCTKAGKTAGSHCSVCGEVLEAQKSVKALGHSWDAGEVTKAATCTEVGEKTYRCTRNGCTEVKTEEIATLDHKIVEDKAVAATCTKAGKTAGSHCSICGVVLVAQKSVKALGHSWDAGEVTKAATCTGSGEKTFHCTRKDCTGVKTEAIAAQGHKVVKDKAVAATCIKAGKTAGSHCGVCGEVLVAQKSVKALGHKWGKWTQKTAATVFKAKTEKRTCSRCKRLEVRTVGKKLTPILTVSESSLVLRTGQSTKEFKVTAMANGDSVKTWKSSNTSIVKISGTASGTCVVTAQKKTGTAKITITLKSGKSKTIVVKVQNAAVKTKKITGIPSSIMIQKGKEVTLNPKLNPITSTEKISYTSSNKKIVDVTAKGRVTGKAKGKATIIVKSGSIVVKCNVTVK